jgi:serine/threonine-protein kinase
VPQHARYQPIGSLGAGGMGEVHLCNDRVIGRSIALKVLDPRRAASDEIRSRFLREARVQGNLEHPAIVPLYDLGSDERGVAFFTMKHVAGATLEQVIDGLARANADVTERFPRRRLLELFRQICQGVEFAHGRGVVHRDLKPANVMIGDFGEVYVLDWGLAKLTPSAQGMDAARVDSGPTMVGQLMGTPGYMAPEQAVGAALDERGDVYALGAVLFELLSLEPLHQGRSASELLRSTQIGADARPSLRAPERAIAPELDAVCVRATATISADRYASVTEMREAIERFLEGDRDVALRRQAAAGHTQNAARAADIAGSLRDPMQRKRALSEAGRALALDPDNAAAQRVLMSVLLEPPERLPPEVERALQAEVDEEARVACRYGFFGYTAFLPLVGIACLQVKEPIWFVIIFSSLAIAVVLCGIGLRRERASAALLTGLCVLVSLAIGAASGIYGALVLVPTLATANTLVMNIGALRSLRWVPLASGCAAILVPALLEWAGILPRAYVFRDGNWLIQAVATEFRYAPLMMLIVTLTALVAPALFVWRLDQRVVDASRRLHVQLWHLAQFLPGRRGD